MTEGDKWRIYLPPGDSPYESRSSNGIIVPPYSIRIMETELHLVTKNGRTAADAMRDFEQSVVTKDSSKDLWMFLNNSSLCHLDKISSLIFSLLNKWMNDSMSIVAYQEVAGWSGNDEIGDYDIIISGYNNTCFILTGQEGEMLDYYIRRTTIKIIRWYNYELVNHHVSQILLNLSLWCMLRRRLLLLHFF